MYHYTLNTSTPVVSSAVYLVYSQGSGIDGQSNNHLFKKYSSHMKYKTNWPYG